MIESELYYLVKSYRDAIEQAHKKIDFVNGHLIIPGGLLRTSFRYFGKVFRGARHFIQRLLVEVIQIQLMLGLC